jgi:hypothetical protein
VCAAQYLCRAADDWNVRKLGKAELSIRRSYFNPSMSMEPIGTWQTRLPPHQRDQPMDSTMLRAEFAAPQRPLSGAVAVA